VPEFPLQLPLSQVMTGEHLIVGIQVMTYQAGINEGHPPYGLTSHDERLGSVLPDIDAGPLARNSSARRWSTGPWFSEKCCLVSDA
jgi:hypothetical protein